MGFLGEINMKTPEITLACFEECKVKVVPSIVFTLSYYSIDDDKRGLTRSKHEGDGEFRQVYFGRLVSF